MKEDGKLPMMKAESWLRNEPQLNRVIGTSTSVEIKCAATYRRTTKLHNQLKEWNNTK